MGLCEQVAKETSFSRRESEERDKQVKWEREERDRRMYKTLGALGISRRVFVKERGATSTLEDTVAHK